MLHLLLDDNCSEVARKRCRSRFIHRSFPLPNNSLAPHVIVPQFLRLWNGFGTSPSPSSHCFFSLPSLAVRAMGRMGNHHTDWLTGGTLTMRCLLHSNMSLLQDARRTQASYSHEETHVNCVSQLVRNIQWNVRDSREFEFAARIAFSFRKTFGVAWTCFRVLRNFRSHAWCFLCWRFLFQLSMYNHTLTVRWGKPVPFFSPVALSTVKSLRCSLLEELRSERGLSLICCLGRTSGNRLEHFNLSMHLLRNVLSAVIVRLQNLGVNSI